MRLLLAVQRCGIQLQAAAGTVKASAPMSAVSAYCDNIFTTVRKLHRNAVWQAFCPEIIPVVPRVDAAMLNSAKLHV